MNAKSLARNALLTALALIIFVIEMQLPALSPVPGLKLGLSNIITVYAVFMLSPADALFILAARILLGSFISGNLSALMYSAAGGCMCYLVMLGLSRLLTARQMCVASVVGAAAHNLGQITLAAIIARTPSIFAYFPALTAGGMLAGLFTGLCAQFMTDRLGKTGGKK